LLLFLVGVEPFLANTQAAPPGWELDKALSPQAKLYAMTRSSIFSLRIINLEQNLVFGAGKKSLGEIPRDSAMVQQCTVTKHYKASQAVAEQSHRTGIPHLGFTEMLRVQEELL